jgi:hypothetical protein
MKNLVTNSKRPLGGSRPKSAPFRPAETAVRRADGVQTCVSRTETPAAVAGQSYRFDVLSGPDKGDFDVLGHSDLGDFDVLGGPDRGDFDALGGPDRGDFDALGGPDRGDFDVVGYKR